MKIKKITLTNIRSYKQQEIEFPDGSILLSGDIGSGKTSVLLGIEFSLFGLQPGQRGSSLLRNGEDSGGVKIEIEVEGQEIIIERTLKRGKTISQDYCAITIDKEKKEISVTELKNLVLRLLNYPKEFTKKQNILYKFTVYTPQEEMKQIILQEPETRINTLRHVFGIDKYKKILENISILTLKIREEKRIKQGITINLEQDKLSIISKENDLESKHYNLVSIEKELFAKAEERKKIQEERGEILKKIEEKNKFQQEIEKTDIIIANKKESFSGNIRIIEKIKNQIRELEELEFDESQISRLEKEIMSNKEDKSNLAQESIEINSQTATLNSKNEENMKLEKKISNLEICPTCLQNVEALYRANILHKARSEITVNNKKLEMLEQEKNQISTKMKIFDSEIFSKERKITDLKILKMKFQEIKEKQIRLQEINQINNFLEKDIELLNNHLGTLKNSVFEFSKFTNIFELKEKELEDALRQERMAEIKVAELKKEIEVFSAQIQELKEKIKKTEQVKTQLNYLTILEEWISKEFMSIISVIEKNVMIKLKAEFSQLFKQWFDMLVPDSFNVQLNDDFTPILEYQDYVIDYAYLSGGERTAVALAYRLSLNQVINSLLSEIKTKDLVILDEPTDGFSEQQLDKMRDILQQINIGQLIIVSHEQKIENFVENVIKFKKENGVSRKE